MNNLRYKKIKPSGYWTETTTINEIRIVVANLGHFPTQEELGKLKRYDLNNAITKHGGYNKFRIVLGEEIIKRQKNYWTEENILNELQKTIETLGYFPRIYELDKIGKSNLRGAIIQHGGINKFRDMLGYTLAKKSAGFWTEENTKSELKKVIKNIGHFPTINEVEKLYGSSLRRAIIIYGGFNKFRKLLGYQETHKPSGYWTKENTIKELGLVIDRLGHFPTQTELQKQHQQSLAVAISKHGSFNEFGMLFGYTNIKKPNAYWSEQKTLNELKKIVVKGGRFPTGCELTDKYGNSSLQRSLSQYGGINKFREAMGYPTSLYEKYISELMSYIGKRGKNSERIVIEISTDWCRIHNKPDLQYNVRLAKGNVLEIVCPLEKRIGIDVTNTESKFAVQNKWIKKDYYKYLDELWVVVFSDSFTDEDYIIWNKNSPHNVKVMTINTFLKELDYSIDAQTQQKIDRYCRCTFHTKNELNPTKSIKE